MILHIFLHRRYRLYPSLYTHLEECFYIPPPPYAGLPCSALQIGCLFGIAFFFGSTSIPIMDHLLNQGTHFTIPCPIRFILDAVLEVSQDMGKTFLVLCPILIKSTLMVMYKDSLVILRYCPFYPFVALSGTGKIQRFSVRSRTYKNIGSLPIYFCVVQSVCMTGERSISAKSFFRSCSVFAANS